MPGRGAAHPPDLLVEGRAASAAAVPFACPVSLGNGRITPQASHGTALSVPQFPHVQKNGTRQAELSSFSPFSLLGLQTCSSELFAEEHHSG